MKTDLSPYVGKWIAICNNKIVSSGSNLKKVMNDAKKAYPKEKPLLTRVPTEETMIL